jgi:hypothetical protein
MAAAIIHYFLRLTPMYPDGSALDLTLVTSGNKTDLQRSEDFSERG